MVRAQFASDDEVDDDKAVSTSALRNILIKTVRVFISHLNHDIGKTRLREKIDQVGIDHPAPGYDGQDQPYDLGMDMKPGVIQT